MKIRLHVHLEGLTGFGPIHPWSLPGLRLEDFEVGPLEHLQKPRLARTDALYVANTELDLGETEVVNPTIVYERIDALISCLRLFKPGYIAANPIPMEALTTNGVWERSPIGEGRSARDQHGGLGSTQV